MLRGPKIVSCLEVVKEVTRRLAGTEILVVVIDKRYEQHVCSVREVSSYHRCTVSRFTGIRFAEGQEKERGTFVE